MTIFGSLNIGRRALRAHMKGMEVSGQNVANANTPGYSRQRAGLQAVAVPLVPGIPLSPGRGVEVAAVQRLSSTFYLSQFNSTLSRRHFWEARQEAFRGAEVILMEPEERGLNQFLGDFFDTWHELSSSPESMAVRTGLRERTVTFTRAVHAIYSRFGDLRRSLQEEIEGRVAEVNMLAAEVAAINEKVIVMHNFRDTSNELLDQLDRAVERLSALAEVQVYHKSNGAVEIFAGGRLLVQDSMSFSLAAGSGEGGVVEVVSHRGRPLHLQAGRLAGLQQAVNEVIPRLQGELDRVVAALVEAVNAHHRGGFGLDGAGNRDFFNPIMPGAVPPSLQFSLNGDLLRDPSLIAAASRPGEPGNGETALAVARQREAPLMQGGIISIIDYYRGVIASLGVEGQECERMVEAFAAAEAQVLERCRSISGVNLDEEVLNMVQFQHAWHAASLFIKTVDDMMAILLRELGR